MEAPKAVSNLVKRFDAHRDAYKAPEYNETQVRRDKMVCLVQPMLDLDKRVLAAKTEHEAGVSSGKSPGRMRKSTDWSMSCTV